MDSREEFDNCIKSMWSNHTVSQIAATLNATTNSVYSAARRIGLKSHKMMSEGSPSPEEIEVRAAEVRAGWTESERRRRLGSVDANYTVPSFTSRQLFPAFQGQGGFR